MIDWITVKTSSPAAYSNCALPGGLLAIALTRPQIAATPARAITAYASASIIDAPACSARRPTLPEKIVDELPDLEPAELLSSARVKEEQWPTSESRELAAAPAIRTPAARSSPLRGKPLQPRVSPERPCVGLRPKPE